MNVIDACNRTCSFCPKSDPDHFPNDPSARMTLESAVRLAETTVDMGFAGVFSMTGWGEPLLHKDLEHVCVALKATNPLARIEIQTNGDPLSAKRIAALQQAGVDRLVINLYDGPEQATYFKQMAGDAQAVEGFVTMQHKYEKEKRYGMVLNNRAGSFVSVGDGIVKIAKPLKKPCYMPFHKIAVDWNLDTYFCDYDWSKRIWLGNLFQTEMADVWMCSEMKTIRENLYKGNREFTPCKYCDAEGTLYGEKQANVIMEFYARTI